MGVVTSHHAVCSSGDETDDAQQLADGAARESMLALRGLGRCSGGSSDPPPGTTGGASGPDRSGSKSTNREPCPTPLDSAQIAPPRFETSSRQICRCAGKEREKEERSTGGLREETEGSNAPNDEDEKKQAESKGTSEEFPSHSPLVSCGERGPFFLLHCC